jgi:RNA polymerase sigma-70 factor (ECF subfamily)
MDDRARSLVAVENISAGTMIKDAGKPLDPEFDQLFREHYSLVYRTAYSVTARVEDAEDVVQIIFLRLIRREFPPDLKTNPKAYLYRAAFNASLSLLRSRRRRLVMGDDVEDLQAPSVAPDPRIGEELNRMLYDAIGELNPRAAEIVILRYVHNSSLGEIGKLLGLSRGAVAISLFRSRARLKRLIRSSMEGNS